MPYEFNSHVDWNYTTSPDGYTYQCQVDQVLAFGIGKMLGGSGELNYMVYSRGNPKNFDDWARVTGDRNWRWNNIRKYFMKSENVISSAIRDSELKHSFGSKGYIGVTSDEEPIVGEYLKGFEQVGKNIIDDIDGSRIGYARGFVTIKDGFRQGAGSRYLTHISESRYIATAKNTFVIKIIFDEQKRAVGVELKTDEGKNIVVNARKEIIISTGALITPQLLMLSGIGPKNHLEKFNITTISDLPVGSNLQDQIAVFIPYKTNKQAVTKPRDPGKYLSGLFVGYAALNESKPDSVPEYNVIGFNIDHMKYLLQFCAFVHKFPVGMCNKLYDEAMDNQVLITLITNLYTRSRGQVQLPSADPMAPPKVISDGFSSDRDLDKLVDYIMDYVKVEKSEAFKSLVATRIDLTKPRCDVFKKNSREYWRCYILCMMVSLRSYSGTCAMGSVVDSRLRVKGVSNLRVADASVMPYKVAGVPYNTVVMIGERTAEMIIEDAGTEYNSEPHEKIRQDQIKNMPN